MNRIHKRTMTDREREENEQRLSDLTDQYLASDSDDTEETNRILLAQSDLGDSDATCMLVNTLAFSSAISDFADCVREMRGEQVSPASGADSEKKARFLRDCRNRAIYQLKMAYDRENPDKESTAWSIYHFLNDSNRRDEAVVWLVRALRYGGFIEANGDKKLLREMLGGNCSEEIADRFQERQSEYMTRSSDRMFAEIKESWRKRKTLKPDILVCGPGMFDNEYLVECISKPGSGQDGDSGWTEEEDSPNKLIRRTIDLGFAGIIQAKTVFGSDPELELPPGKTMKDFVRDIERERHGVEIEDDSELDWSDRIDAVWYVTNGDCESFGEQEREFIRSVMELPDAMLVVNLSCTVVSREHLIAAIDGLTDIIDPGRIVLVDSGYYGQTIDSRWRLIETVKRNYPKSGVFASDEEKQSFESAWTEYFVELLGKWHERSEKNVDRCIRHAAGRAQFIMEQEEEASWSDLLEEGRSLLEELFDLVKGDTDKIRDDAESKKDVSHTAELLNNISIMIYELGGCCGHVAVKSDVTAILRACHASDLPEDAAAITYAVGMAAKAYFESGRKILREKLSAVFAESKEEGLRIPFVSMHEDDPASALLFDDDDDDDDDGGCDFDGGCDDGDDDGGNDGDDDGGPDRSGLAGNLFGSLLKYRSPLCFLTGVGRPGSGLDSISKDPGEDAGHDGDEAVDYGSGQVVSSSGCRPDFRDNASGKRFRLPGDYPVPGDVLKTDAVRGGWGYAMRDAAVISGGVSVENAFIEARVREELRRMENSGGEKYVFADYRNFAHELVRDGNDSYDLLFVQVEIISEADWDRLKADWESHDGYEDDEAGRRKHEEWRESRTVRFTEYFWFNVNDLFFIDGDEGPDGPAD